MTAPLTTEQRELLSAFADDEVNDAERQAAEALLEREDAREYLKSLRAMSALVAKHASVKAPVGLAGRVMSEIKHDVKPAQGKLHTLPALSWQTPLWAAAAVVIVSLAIMFGPSLFTPKPVADGAVARDVLDNLPREPQEALSASPPGETRQARTSGGGSGGRVLERSVDDRPEDDRNAGSIDKVESMSRKLSDKDDTKEVQGMNGEAGDSPKHDPALDDDAKDEANESQSSGSAEPGDGYVKRPKRQRGQPDGSDVPAPPAPPPAAPPTNEEGGKDSDSARRDALKAKNAKANTGQGARDTQDENDPKPTEAKKADDKSAGEPADWAKDSEEAKAKAISVSIDDAASLKGQTDVLWVSSLYGDTTLTDNDSDIEDISIEIDADKMPELLAALRKLARDQGYGPVSGNNAGPELRAEKEPEGIASYLPSAESREPAKESAPESAKESPQRVKLVIHLK